MTAQESNIKGSAKVHTVYKNAAGKRVPSVSTILNELAKPALIDWAWKLGLQGINYREYVDSLADIGTLAHRMILDHLCGLETDSSAYNADTVSLASNCFASYLSWENANKIEPVMMEKPLVSEVYQYGGTADFLGYVNGRMTLVDFKTGKAIYPEHFYQLAAYSAIINECRPELGNIEQYIVLNIPRGEGDAFDTKVKASLVPEWSIFQSALNIYRQKQVKS